MVPVQFKLIVCIFNLYKMVSLYYFNVKGFEMAKIIKNIIKYQYKSIISIKVMLILICWIFQIIYLIICAILSFKSSRILYSYPMISFVLIFSMFWSLAGIIWIISISYTIRLEQMKDFLGDFCKTRSGLFELVY